jgi:hypothetical protein
MFNDNSCKKYSVFDSIRIIVIVNFYNNGGKRHSSDPFECSSIYIHRWFTYAMYYDHRKHVQQANLLYRNRSV